VWQIHVVSKPKPVCRLQWRAGGTGLFLSSSELYDRQCMGKLRKPNALITVAADACSAETGDSQ
jgi:hypothetical protein